MPDLARNEAVVAISDLGWVNLQEFSDQPAVCEGDPITSRAQYSLIEVSFGDHPYFKGDPTRPLNESGEWKFALLSRTLWTSGKATPEISVTCVWVRSEHFAELARDPAELASSIDGASILIAEVANPPAPAARSSNGES